MIRGGIPARTVRCHPCSQTVRRRTATSARMGARVVWPSVVATCLALSILLFANIAAPLERVTPGGGHQAASPPLASPPSPLPPSPLPPSRITLRPSQRYAEAFDAAIDGEVWLVAAGPVELRHQGIMHSSDPAAGERRLRLLNRSTSTGSDALGPFTRTAWAWRAGSLAFHTGVRLYHSTLVFEQRYGSEATGTAGHGLSSSFPCFGLPTRAAARAVAAAAVRRYWLQWDGDMAGQLYRAGPWQVVVVGGGGGGGGSGSSGGGGGSSGGSCSVNSRSSTVAGGRAPRQWTGGHVASRALLLGPRDLARHLTDLELHGRRAAGGLQPPTHRVAASNA